MKKLIVFFIYFITVPQSSYGQTLSVDIKYLGNEGFLIKSENRKVLIDALFKSESVHYLSPTDSMITQMIHGEQPYDKVDLLLVTHRHSDHFKPDLTITFLENNPSCKLIANDQVVKELRTQQGFEKVRSRIVEITSDAGNHSSFVENGIEVDTFSLKHGPYMRNGVNIHAEIKNTAFIVNMEGTCFYHSGDATVRENLDVLKDYEYRKKPVDIMFLQRYDTSPTSKQFIAKTIKPNMIIAMHITPDQIDESIKKFMTHYPYGKIFREQGETLNFINNVNYHTLSGPYLGQQPPNDVPEVFAPGIISSRNIEHSYPSFSPDGKKVIWSMWRVMPGLPNTALEQIIMCMEEKDGIWTYPDIISFSGKYRDGGPQFSTDGQYIFYSSRRLVQTDTSQEYQWKKYYAQLTANGWSEGKEIPEIPQEQSYANIYHMHGRTPIVKVENEFYRLPDINMELSETKGFYCTFNISKDGKMAVFSSNKEDTEGGGDLYVSYRKPDDSWGQPRHLENQINTHTQERFAGFSPDGQYLFFTRPRSGNAHDIWWVNVNNIDEFKE